MNAKQRHDICRRYNENKIQTIGLQNYPERIRYEEIKELKYDMSQGTGNVIVRFFYFPAIDVLGIYADF